ncbi:MAG: FAD:protein FMN transferase [Spirochaetota bacterium]
MRIQIYFLFTILLFVSCKDKIHVLAMNGSTMGTYYKVLIAKEISSPAKQQLKKEIDSLLVDVNQKMSTYIPDSELSRLNQTGTGWTKLSAETFSVILYSIGLFQKTAGAYDITVGPLVNLWGFGPKKEQKIPDQIQIDTVKKYVGSDLLAVQEKSYQLRKKYPEVYIDLSSLAKGYGVDAVSKLLREKGYRDHMVEIGGEIRVSGTKKGAAWKIGIETPKKESTRGESVKLVIPLQDASIATSGNYRNFFELKDTTYSHMIDPRTGRPVQHSLLSVSVLAKNCMQADAWATALMVLGPEKGYELATQNNIKAYFIYRDKNGMQTKATENFQKVVK